MKVQSSIALETRKAQELSLLGFRYFRRARFLTRGPLSGPNPRR
jgi:hypothetical protein